MPNNIEEYELPLFERYTENQQKLNSRQADELRLRGLRYKMFVPSFVTEKNKYVVYVAVLVMCGLLGVFLRKTFELDFNEDMSSGSEGQ